MTSASSSEPRRRNLAVYHVPPPPSGWEGHDLVRIVDALGVGAAWLDARRLGSIVALHLRADAADAWTSLVGEDGQAIVVVGDGADHSAMRQRDPIAASFASPDGRLLSQFAFHDGALTIETSVAISFTPLLASPIDIIDASVAGGSCLTLSLRTDANSLEGGSISGASRRHANGTGPIS